MSKDSSAHSSTNYTGDTPKACNTTDTSNTSGILYIVATPIGNLGDMTPRAIKVLQSVERAYSEDTRVSHRLFTHFEIDTQLKRFDDKTGTRKIPEIIDLLAQGKDIALVSDAGTPVISDPGMPLVAAAHEAGYEVVSVPGASAAVAALSISGLPAHAYYYGGFLPRKRGKRESLLRSLDTLNASLIFFESPHRVAASLQHLAELYPNRQAAVARELTKRHEELVRANLQDLAKEFTQRKEAVDAKKGATIKGEFVILIAPLKSSGCAADD